MQLSLPLGDPRPVAHSVFLDVSRSFILLNDDGALTDEPVNAEDIEPGVFDAAGWGFVRSLAWSSDIRWAFVIRPDGIALIRWDDQQGFFCRKRSSEFIRLFVEAPH